MDKIFIAGRIEFLGKHTDYCGGNSLVCAIDKGFHVNFEPNNDDCVKLTSKDTNEVIEIPLNKISSAQKNHWLKYPQTVVRRVFQNFQSRKLCGVNINFRSDLPQAAGLSSSSALMIATFLAIKKVNKLEEFEEYQQNILNDLDLAEYLGCVENGQSYKDLTGEKGVGTFGGSQDHTAIICCKNDSLSQFSFCPTRHHKDFALLENLVFVVASSGLIAEKTGAAKEKYNRLSLLAKEITSFFNENLTVAQLIEKYGFDTLKRKLPNQDLTNRLQQFYTESFEIIPKVAEHLNKNEVEKIGELVDLSHRNADKFLSNQTPETNFLQANARELGAIAASAFGAGFGGSVYALVQKSEAENFKENWKINYLEKFPLYIAKSKFFITKASESKI